MKKNKMMRIASVLLVAVLLSTCAISGTFAKYTTSAEAADTARVAQWGVTVTASTGSSFAKTYKNGSDTLTVEAEEKVVAPGTSSDDVDGNVTFEIHGTPEVATKVEIAVEATSEIKLAAGEYLDYTTGNNLEDTFTLDQEYYPVKFTLVKTAGNVTETLVNGGQLSEVASALNEQSEEFYAPNTPLDVIYTLTWVWDYASNNTNDKADTYLANSNQTLGYTLNITVTQVD